MHAIIREIHINVVRSTKTETETQRERNREKPRKELQHSSQNEPYARPHSASKPIVRSDHHHEMEKMGEKPNQSGKRK